MILSLIIINYLDRSLHFIAAFVLSFPDYENRVAASPPINIHGATCEMATDYTKKKNVMRLVLSDGAEYLFVAQDLAEMALWQKKIQHFAGNIHLSYTSLYSLYDCLEYFKGFSH